jgi:heme-degrading monooxygenase HmoA
MTRLTRRTVVQTGAVAVGGLAIDLLAFIQQASAQTQTPAPSMALSVARVKVAAGSEREIARHVQESFVPLVSKEPGFQAFYLVSTPGDEVAMISMFRDQKAAEAFTRKTLGWIAQTMAAQVHGSVQFTTGQVLVHKRA